MRMITVYVGLDAKAFIQDCQINFGGVTHWQATGSWAGKNNIPTTVVQFLVPVCTNQTVNLITRLVVNELTRSKQKSAMIKWTDDRVEFITEDDRPC